MNEKTWKNNYQQIAIDKLNLDLKNPRTNTGEKQDLEGVVGELLGENIIDLIESISSKGYAAVSVAMVVHEHNKDIVIDGNRRLLAVKILKNPDLVRDYIPDIISNAEFEKIKLLSKQKKESIDFLTAIVYPSRVEAEKEMSILHLDGEAVKKWKPLRQYRYFQNRINKEKYNIFDIAELLGVNVDRIQKGLVTIQLFEKAKQNIDFKDFNTNIFNDKDFKTDKFQKTVVNEEGERFLGYSFDREHTTIVIKDESIFFERMRLILLEMYNEKSNFLQSAQYPTKNRSEFFQTIDNGFLGTKSYQRSLENEEKKLKDNGKNLFGEESRESPGDTERQERSDRKPSGLFASSVIPYKLENRSLQALYDELRNPDILKFPNASHDLLRSFLECSLVAYLKHKNTGKYQDILKKKKKKAKTLTLTNILDYISSDSDSPIDDYSVRMIAKQLISDDTKEYSVERMDMVNHNENWCSTESEVRAAWIKIEPLFKVILNPKK